MSRKTEQVIERAIATKLVDGALANGWSITVNDGEDDVVIKSRDRALILHEMWSTDEDWLRFYDLSNPVGKQDMGWVRLIWGNVSDVISDYHTALEDTAMIKDAMALSDDIEEGRFAVSQDQV